MTLLKILESKKIFLIASGESKKGIIQRALLGEMTSQVPASLLRFHKDVTFLVDQEATSIELFNKSRNILKEEIKSYLKHASIKVFASDLDFTLSPVGENLRDEVIKKLELLAQKGIDIAVISGAKFERIKSQFLDFLPQDFPWEKLHIYAHIAGIGYDFDSQGNPKIVYKVEMDTGQIDKINEVIEELKENFPEDFKDFYFYPSINIKITITLTEQTRSLERYEKLLEFLQEKLKGTGLIINGSGHRKTIDITRADKSYALINLRDKFKLSWDQIIYVGDTFCGKFGNDNPTLIPGVWNFNVGSTYKIPDNIFSLPIKGDLGTEILIEALLELLP
jgi:HAD superfamily hydrolase (TIGR01484 family)